MLKTSRQRIIIKTLCTLSVLVGFLLLMFSFISFETKIANASESNQYTFGYEQGKYIVKSPEENIIYSSEHFNAEEVRIEIYKDKGTTSSDDYTIDIMAKELSIDTESQTEMYDDRVDNFDFTISTEDDFPYLAESCGGYIVNSLITWTYKRVGDLEFSQPEAGDIGNSFSFGKEKEVSEYTIRAIVPFKMWFDSKLIVKYYETTIDVEIVKRELDFSKIEALEISYGNPLSNVDFEEYILAFDGIWSTAKDVSQNSDNILNEVLSVGNYTIKLDFEPKDTNLQMHYNIPIDIKIVPYTIRIGIYEKQSVFEQPLEELDYYVSKYEKENIPNNLSVEDVDICFVMDDVNVPGEYEIRVKSGNKNFFADGYSMTYPDSNMIDYGKYYVYPHTVFFEWENGSKITLKNQNGLPFGAKIYPVSIDSSLPVKYSDVDYLLGKFAFKLMDNIKEFSLEGTTNVSFENLDNATKFLLISNGESWTKLDVQDRAVSFEITSDSLPTICFVGYQPPIQVPVWGIVNTILLIVIVLVAIVFIVIVKKYKRGKI